MDFEVGLLASGLALGEAVEHSHWCFYTWDMQDEMLHDSIDSFRWSAATCCARVLSY